VLLILAAPAWAPTAAAPPEIAPAAGSTLARATVSEVGLTVEPEQDPGPVFTLKFEGDGVFTGKVMDGSSRELKQDLVPVAQDEVLETPAALPLYRWSYIKDEEGVRHVGPVAEDFHAAFGLGRDNKQIAPADTNGAALAAIQALAQQLEAKDQEIEELRQGLEALEAASNGGS
jgi:hypothetical protein